MEAKRQTLKRSFSNKSSNHHSARLGIINARTCRDRTKLEQILQATYTYKQHLCFVSETRMCSVREAELLDDFNGDCLGWSFVYSGLETKVAAGVGLIMSPEAELLKYECILKVRLKLFGIKFAVFSVYAPQDTISKGAASKDRFSVALKRALTAEHRDRLGYRNLLAGDFNAIIGPQSAQTKFIGPNRDQ
eukprot:gene2143-2434_t